MRVHSLSVEDFFDYDFTLIGIHTTIEDYQLAFLLNKYLAIKLKRIEDLDVSVKKNPYSLYEYRNEKLDCTWFLVSNSCKTKSDFTGLFEKGEVTNYLIPEKKKVDFFLKLDGNFNTNSLKKLLEDINVIPQIIISYTIDVRTLKSKEFLIF